VLLLVVLVVVVVHRRLNHPIQFPSSLHRQRLTLRAAPLSNRQQPTASTTLRQHWTVPRAAWCSSVPVVATPCRGTYIAILVSVAAAASLQRWVVAQV